MTPSVSQNGHSQSRVQRFFAWLKDLDATLSGDHELQRYDRFNERLSALESRVGSGDERVTTSPPDARD